MSTLYIGSRNSVQVCLGYSEQGIKYKSALVKENQESSTRYKESTASLLLILSNKESSTCLPWLKGTRNLEQVCLG